MRGKKFVSGLLTVAMVVPVFQTTVFARSGIEIDELNFPDSNFRNIISKYDLDDSRNLLPDEIAAVTELDISGKNIQSLEGIKYFSSLTSLECDQNSLTSIDVSGMVNLDYLDCSNNANLTSLNISGCTLLRWLNCSCCNLTSLDASEFENLEYLQCVSNANLSTLNVSGCTALDNLFCSNCKLTSLDVSGNKNITYIMCYSNNSLSSLNVTGCSLLENLDCSSTSLTAIDMSGFSNLKYLDCDSITNLVSLNLSGCSSLEYLDCYETGLTSLDLSNLKNLNTVDCDYTSLSNINIRGCSSLECLYCENSNLSSLDLSTNTALKEVYCYNNNIASINICNNPTLIEVCAYEPITDEEGYLVYGREITEEEYESHEDDYDFIGNCIWINNENYFFENIVYADAETTFLTTTPTPVPTQAPTSGMTAFAERLYTEALNRNYDKAGRDYWVSQLRSGVSGADVARQFFFSDEFVNANLSDSVFVDRLYRTFMDREADEAGKTYWMTQLSSGAMTREDVFNGFINSPEWANLCLKSGIVSGGTQAPTITVEPSEAVTAFATRLYTTCLGREADAAGVSWWANELANMRRTGTTAAQGFFFSDEYVSANHSDAEFVTALYSTFMDRAYDQAGYDYWMGELSNGCTRENVLERFAGCDEFGNICADAGIIR